MLLNAFFHPETAQCGHGTSSLRCDANSTDRPELVFKCGPPLLQRLLSLLIGEVFTLRRKSLRL